MGRWQGTYTGPGVMIVARVEVERDGKVRLSAPNAFMDVGALDAAEQTDVMARLSAGLAAAWPYIAPRPMDFDGHVFRNPGGVAPQLEWHRQTRHMTMYVYPGAQPTIRLDLAPVKDFE